MWYSYAKPCASFPCFSLLHRCLLVALLVGGLQEGALAQSSASAEQMLYNKQHGVSQSAGYALPQKGATVASHMAPGSILSGHFGVNPALSATEETGIGRDSVAAYTFDWNTLVPTLNTGTADWVEADWIGYWRDNFSSVTKQHPTAPGTPDLDYEPSGGEPYDVEAFYFDNDADSFYVAIVTSVGHVYTGTSLSDVGVEDPRATGDSALVRTGDLSINLFTGPARAERNGSTWHYDYGVDLTHENRDVRSPLPTPFANRTYPVMRDLAVGNTLYKTSSDAGGAVVDNPPDSDWYVSGEGVDTEAFWEHSNFDPFSPTFTGSLLGTVRTNYYELTFAGGALENDHPTFVYEFAIPRSLFGTANPGNGDQIGFMFLPGCRNDGNATNAVVKLVATVDDPIDFGDAPAGFGTLLSGNGPYHSVNPKYTLGATIDAETDGQPGINADDDGADEDGVTFPTLISGSTGVVACQSNDLTVNLNNAFAATAMLDGWIDYNGNGTFDHPAEHINAGTSLALTAGNNSVAVTPPCSAVRGATYARFRLSQAGGLAPTGPASTGEIEDYRIDLIGVDYGDALNTFATLGASNGPAHVIVSGYSLGATVDVDNDGQPSANADGDGADEDGITFPAIVGGGNGLMACLSNDLTVNLTNTGALAALLDGWIDYNGNGTFEHPAEHINAGTSIALVAGNNTVSVSVPCSAVLGNTTARFRLSTAGGLAPTGPAANGEVEDYVAPLRGLDYGDAPDGYGTTASASGPNHLISTGLYMGASIDADADGQPGVNADNDGADEDGIATLPAFNTDSGQSVALNVALTNTTGQGAFLACWIDFNRDGSFDAGERQAATLAAGQSAATLNYTTPSGMTAGQSYVRCRLSATQAEVANPTGAATSGEVEDYPLTISAPAVPEDFGDAPDSYLTLLASNGPRHTIVGFYNLGNATDGEADGQPSANADGDGTDEDGLTSISLITGDTGLYNCQTNDLTVNLTNNNALTALLDGWIDFNGNGTFDHPTEHINGGTSVALNPGNNTVSVAVPCTAINAATYARYRLSETGGLTPSGPAASGEVEDYRINLVSLDYGDAPDSYGTSNSQNGAGHAITTGLSLGNPPDADADGQPGSEASGDAGGDEDGIPNLPVLTNVPGEQFSMFVDVTNTTGSLAWLSCWIDFNLDGVFATSERLQASFTTSGTVQLDYTNPPDVQAGPSYIRCRIAFDQTQINLPTGMAGSGEVEDYTVDISGSLPVELSAFEAASAGPTTVALSWSTLSERDNAGFEVQYQLTPQGTGTAQVPTWESTGFMEGAGTTDQAQQYRYRIDGLNPGVYKFRLKQVDLGGRMWYSEVLELRMELPGGMVLEPAYPNPFGPATGSATAHVRFVLAERALVRVSLYDVRGRLMETLYEGHVSANEIKALTIDGAQWPAGVYLIRLDGLGISTTQKLTLMR